MTIFQNGKSHDRHQYLTTRFELTPLAAGFPWSSWIETHLEA